MYKVKEAADVLGVTRVEIFEIMLSQREIFEPFVEKNNSITYISEEGLNLLRVMLESDLKPQKSSTETVLAEVPVQENDLFEEPVLIELEMEDPEEDDQFIISARPSIAAEEDDDLIGQWLKDIQDEDAEADLHDGKLKDLRGQVTQLRNKMLSLDSEIKRKDEAIKHYHEIMKDDIRWLEDLEHKTQLIVKHELVELGSSKAEILEEEDKNNFFKFFKR